VNRAEKRKSSSGRERNSHWRAGRGSPIARFAGAAGNPRGRGRSGRLRRRRRRDQAGGQAGGGDSRSDGWTPSCSLWLGVRGRCGHGGGGRCGVPCASACACRVWRKKGGRDTGLRLRGGILCGRNAPHSSFHLPLLQFLLHGHYSIHMVITCYYS